MGISVLWQCQEEGEPGVWKNVHLGLDIMPLVLPHLSAFLPIFWGGLALSNLLWIWDYKNMIIFGKASQMPGEQL
jgi:hypothetical protein